MLSNEIGVAEVMAYVERDYGRKVTRQTVYNWIRKGRKGDVLKAIKIKTPLGAHEYEYLTTAGWVDEFLFGLGLSKPTIQSVERHQAVTGKVPPPRFPLVPKR